ncbi:MAG TPA: DUF1844 domain-containing protein [Pyrinomonadaceae bacterium]|jgi:hypothetical protein
MSEEQGNFKVTDRRLFNADGTPRDVPPEEKPAEEKQVSPASGPTNEAAPTASEPQKTVADAPAATEEEDLSDADDPASFLNFLMTLASNAAATLGMMEHPVTHQRDVDLEAGKHWIDVLAMLERKTSGNLTSQEQQILKGLLSDLRMQYVSLVNSAAAKAPRGFTGRDILGGS